MERCWQRLVASAFTILESVEVSHGHHTICFASRLGQSHHQGRGLLARLAPAPLDLVVVLVIEMSTDRRDFTTPLQLGELADDARALEIGGPPWYRGVFGPWFAFEGVEPHGLDRVAPQPRLAPRETVAIAVLS